MTKLKLGETKMNLDQIMEKVENKDYWIQLKVAKSVAALVDKRFWELLDEAEKTNGDNLGIVRWCREIKSKVYWIDIWVDKDPEIPEGMLFYKGILDEEILKGEDEKWEIFYAPTPMELDQILSNEADKLLWDIVDKVIDDMQFNYTKLERGVISQKRMIWGIQRVKEERFKKRMVLRDEVENLKVLAEKFIEYYVKEDEYLTVTYGRYSPIKLIFKQLYIIAIMSAEQDALTYDLNIIGDKSERVKLPDKKTSKKKIQPTKPKKPTNKGGKVIPLRID